MDFKLNLSIDAESLRELKKSGLKITIAKGVSEKSPNVAWLVFEPFQGNVVQWTEEYGIFASADDVTMNGAKISRMSEIFTAQDGTSYNFADDATFHGPFTDDGVKVGAFRVNNKMTPQSHRSLIFGLEQKACINNTTIKPSPLNIAYVPAMLSVSFVPMTNVYVWLQNEYTYGTVLTTIESSYNVFTFGNGVNEVNVLFDYTTGRFIKKSQ